MPAQPIIQLRHQYSMVIRTACASQACKEKLRRDYWPTLITELIIWPPYQVCSLPCTQSAVGTACFGAAELDM